MAIAGWWRYYCCVLMLISVTSVLSYASEEDAMIDAIRVENDEWARIEDGILILTAGKEIPLRVIGRNITPLTTLRFTSQVVGRGENCDDLTSTKFFTLDKDSVESRAAISFVELDKDYADDGDMMICAKEMTVGDDDGNGWIHMGNSTWLKFRVAPPPVKKTLLPMPIQIVVIIILLCLSGLFSGLNLGLMSLDKTDLKIVENCGSPSEKRYAKLIAPLRKRGNFLLCTILLGNVLVNNTLTILMDDLTGSGAVAVVIATMCIVVFGEIIPQAVCSRHGLAVGARTVWITRFFMVATFPLSFPISKILDLLLGEEIGNVYNRDRLRELLKVTEHDMDLLKDEVQIIAGALELSKKTVGDIMTKLEDVYMIDYNAVLDFETMNELIKSGYTRIPVYENEKTNIVTLLNIKDLAFVDPDDHTPLKTVCKFYNHPVNFVFEDVKLDKMLQEFKTGRSHMSFVHCVNNEGEGDPFYETLGVVTLEDVIEEIIQSEIVDETDVVTDNRKKVPRQGRQQRDFSVFNQPDDNNYPRLSPQLALATFQYLSTSVPPFKPDLISETVLQRLIKQDVIINFHLTESTAQDVYLFQMGKVCDYFIMILQGRAEVDVGKEHMKFEAGAFVYFGTQALAALPSASSSMSKHQSLSSISSNSDSIYARQVNYTPDFTLKAIDDLLYIKIRRAHYLAAYRATLIERHPKTPEILDSNEDPFTKEWKRAISVADPPNSSELCDGQIKVEVGSEDDLKDATLTSPSLDSDLAVQTPLCGEHSGLRHSISSAGKDPDTPLISSCDVTPDTEAKHKDVSSQL